MMKNKCWVVKIGSALLYKGIAFNISALNGLGCKSLIFGLYDLIEQKNEEE